MPRKRGRKKKCMRGGIVADSIREASFEKRRHHPRETPKNGAIALGEKEKRRLTKIGFRKVTTGRGRPRFGTSTPLKRPVNGALEKDLEPLATPISTNHP